MLKRIKTESPEHVGIVETVWGGGEPKRKSPKKNELDALFADLVNKEDKNQTWSKIKSKYSKGKIINSPGIMKFLLRCINGNIWPEEVICDILEMGAAGPHVASLLDKANKLSSDRVLASSNSILLPERALVWTLEQLVKKMTDNQHEDASLDALLSRSFSHNHLVGSLRGLDSNVAIVFLDFLVNKAKTTNFTNENGVDLMKLCAWIGAVVDAHPTTISADGNEEYLVEALAVINSKLELLSEYDTIEKLFMKNRRQQEQQTSGKYSVEILKL